MSGTESDHGTSSRFAGLRTWPAVLTLGFFALILLVGLGYVEEDWRGERVWAQTKAELEARGESFDSATFIPPTVPDEQNFGALDYFQADSAERTRIGHLLEPVYSKTPVSLDDAKENKDKGWLPYLGNWTKGESVDTASVEKQLESFLHRQDPGAQIPPGATPIDVFTKICPVLADLRQANPRRPLCRFYLDYNPPKPWLMKFGPLVDQIRVAKVLSYDSKLALLSHRPDIALEDSQVVWKIESGLSQEPLVISGLVAMGVVAIQLSVVEQGLYEHDWSDAQLAQLDDDLGKLDFLAEGQVALRGDVAMSMVPTADAFVANRALLLDLFDFSAGSPSGFDYKSLESWQALGVRMFYTYVPNGWLRINEAENVRSILDCVRNIDPKARRVYSERADTITNAYTSAGLGFLAAMAGPVLESIRKFAYFQAQIDMARIACRLERYRLAHGNYPATLDALVPAYGTDLPHDIMNGQPYIYRLEKDGSFTLYSVGWNQKDDHGDISTPGMSYASPYPSDASLDWVWLNHPLKKK